MNKRTPSVIFQNDPHEEHISLKNEVEKVILKGRIWLSIFDGYTVTVGDSVRYGGRNFKVEYISPSHGPMVDLKISRVFNKSKNEKIPSHKEATEIYINEKNPPEEEPEVEVETRPEYILYMHQRGGCDYTIGCGNQIVSIYATNEKKAIRKARETIRDYGKENIHESVLYKVSWKKELV